MEATLLSRLLIVRHGESTAMADATVGGPIGCRGLTERGRAQAGALRDRFASGHEPAVEAVYSSPLLRARETTEIVLPALGDGAAGGELEICVHDGLEEMRLGPADGLSWEAARQRFGFVDPAEEPYTPVIPGGESRAEFRHRVAQALNDIAAAHPGATVFIGGHGGVTSAAVAMAFGIGPSHRGVGAATAVTAITELELVDRGGRRGWQLRRFNDAAHLAGGL